MPEILDNVRRVHFIGVGGIGMLALAQYLHAKGFSVSGSDTTDSDMLQNLRALGVEVHIGHSAGNVGKADLVVYTAAARADNVEVAEASRRGIPIVKRAELLGQICARGPSVAIAGTHGKTTTTALTGHLVRSTGLDATIFAGGLTRTDSHQATGPALIGAQDSFVVEADEYDRSFLHLHPDVSVITNLEYDHPDCYDTLEAMIEAYASFVGQTTRRVLISGQASDATRATASLSIPVETYGTSPADTWSASAIEYSPPGSSFTLTNRGKSLGTFSTQLLGLHNVLNGIGAIAAACAFTGFSPEALRQPLATFGGTERRLQIKGTVNGVTVIDDYAHHPTEVRATLTALSVLDGRVRVIFQPHTYTRTQAFLREFAEALSLAQEVVLLQVYGARETPIPGVDSGALAAELRQMGVDVALCSRDEEAVGYVVRTVRSGDIIVTMGAGSVTNAAPKILTELNGVSVSVG